MATESKEFKHKIPGEWVYDGILWNSGQDLKFIENFKNFQTKPDDIIIETFPKSGTIWMQQIVGLVMLGGDFERDKIETPAMKIPYIDANLDLYGMKMRGLETALKLESPRVYRTHCPHRFLPKDIDETGCKVIYVMRSPKDTAVSYYHFYKRSFYYGPYEGNWDEFFDMFINGHVHMGSWFDHVLDIWKQKDNPNVLICRFEDMKKNLAAVFKKVCDFLGKPMSDELIEKCVEYSQFSSMKDRLKAIQFSEQVTIDLTENGLDFFRKGEVGDWKNHFSEEQSTIFDELLQKKLGHIGGTWSDLSGN